MREREYAAALNERLRFERGEHRVGAQHFIENVMERRAGSPTRRRIETTLDASLQREVAGIIAAQKRDLLEHGAHSVAVAVIDNRTGEWLAWEGSGDYFGTDFGGAIDGVTALRQPGSALKPFTYALAFERGDSPATVLADVPSHFPTAENGVVYTPRNYDGRYRGPLRVRAALAGSENVPAVAMAAKLGPASLLRFLSRVGFSDFGKTADYYGVGLTLGDAEVKLEQLVAAYSVFARGGVYIEPTMFRQPATGRRQRVISQRTAFWITDILSDPDAREYVFGRGGNLDFPFAVAVKTGTSQAYRDNWTVGYTRDVTVGVWVGNFDRKELRNSTGVTGAGPIFHAVMLSAAKRAHGGRLPIGDDAPIVNPPAGIERAPICALSGLRPSTSCPNLTSEWVASDAPVRFCSWHHDGYVDWPAEYQGWARSVDVSSARPAKSGRDVRSPLQILSPPNGATYLIDPTLRMAYQTLKLRASSRRVTWHIDQQQVAATEWELQPGWHTVTAIDDAGRRESVQIVVK
jgi:penicillin-binding protein 1C